VPVGGCALSGPKLLDGEVHRVCGRPASRRVGVPHDHTVERTAVIVSQPGERLHRVVPAVDKLRGTESLSALADVISGEQSTRSVQVVRVVVRQSHSLGTPPNGLTTRVVGFAVVEVEVDSPKMVNERQVKHVYPEGGLGAVVAMIMPGALGGQDEISAMHDTLLALNDGVAAITLQHEPAGAGRVPVHGRRLSRPHDLVGDVEGVRCEVLREHARVRQDECSPVCLVKRDQIKGVEEQRAGFRPLPHMRLEDIRGGAGDV
jgi:hypothetical protein